MNLFAELPKNPVVQVHTTSKRGFTPDEVAKRCADKLISVSDTAVPEIRDQAIAYRKEIEKLLTFYMKEAINSDRTTVYHAIVDAGFPDLAKAIRRL